MNKAASLIAFIAIALLPNFAFAATMSILPATRSASVGDLITARVSINTQGVAINQGEADIEYPSNLLTVVSVSKSSSIFSFWITDPTDSSGNGMISFNGGVPTPGYSGADGTVATITFKAKAPGTASITLGNPDVRANDGLGTDVLQSTNSATFSIATPAVVSVPSTSTVVPSNTSATQTKTTTPIATVVLTSKTNPDQNSWYQNTNPSVDWSVPSAASEVEVIASTERDAAPSVVYKDTTNEEVVSNLSDGVWYFNLRYKLNETWSGVNTYVLNVDTTPPVVDSHSFTYDAKQHALIISVGAHDQTSGISDYQLTVDGGTPKYIPVTTIALGPYAYPISIPGTHTATLRILDKAGNHSDITESFTVPTSLLDTPVFIFGKLIITLFALLVCLGLISFISLIIAITGWVWIIKRIGSMSARRAVDRKKLHRAFILLRKDLDKHLSVMGKAKRGKELSVAETELGQDMHADINDLEKYLQEETDLFD